MARMLVIDGRETVVNIIVVPDSADGSPAWPPPPGRRIERAPQGVGIGWSKAGGDWQPPAPPTPEAEEGA